MDLILANVGTPMMWMQGGHLVFGNTLIGLIEGLLIARLFGTRPARSVLIMILANYVSAFAGFFAITGTAHALQSSWTGDVPLVYHLTSLTIAMGLTAFALTILIEWPFCRWILRGLPTPNKKAWTASVIAQVVSYSLLVPLYWISSATGVVSGMTLHDDTAFVRSPIATVYYINPDDGDVWRIQTDGTGQERVLEADIPPGTGPLAFTLAEDGQSWDLFRRAEPSPYCGSGERLAESVAVGRAYDNSFPANRGRVFEDRFDAPDLRAEAVPAWRLCTFREGSFRVQPADYWGDLSDIAVEIPCLLVWLRAPTVLSSEQVVFELDGYIMLLDPKTRDLGVLTRGRGPAVIEPGETFNTWVNPSAPDGAAGGAVESAEASGSPAGGHPDPLPPLGARQETADGV